MSYEKSAIFSANLAHIPQLDKITQPFHTFQQKLTKKKWLQLKKKIFLYPFCPLFFKILGDICKCKQSFPNSFFQTRLSRPIYVLGIIRVHNILYVAKLIIAHIIFAWLIRLIAAIAILVSYPSFPRRQLSWENSKLENFFETESKNKSRISMQVSK